MTEESQLPIAEVYLEANFSEPLGLTIAGREVVVFSHGSPGRTTPSEDAAACFEVDESTGVLVVADGVGGHQAGEIAAAHAMTCIRQHLEQRQNASLRETILDAIEFTNQTIMQLGLGAATTLTLVELQRDFVRPYHIGDSIITQISQRGRIKWQSLAHAPIGYAVEAGVLTEEEGMIHPDRHLVSNVMGQEDMSVSLGPAIQMAARDTLILYSDGVSDNVSTEELATFLKTGPLDSACKEVIQLAQTRMEQADDMLDIPGKPDDLTIIACRGATGAGITPEPDDSPQSPPQDSDSGVPQEK